MITWKYENIQIWKYTNIHKEKYYCEKCKRVSKKVNIYINIQKTIK